MKRTKSNAACMNMTLTQLEASLAARHETETRVEREAAEENRKARAVLSTYSPRRQWSTRYGAAFVESVGFTKLA